MRRWLSLFALVGLICGSAAVAATTPAMPTVPADVAAAIAKLRAHQPLSPAERALIQNYGRGMTAKYGGGAGNGGANASSGGTTLPGGVFATGSGQAQNPCTRHGTAVGLAATPARDTYLAMAKDAMHTYRAHLLPDAQASLDTTLGKYGNAVGSDIAAILIAHGNGSAAVVSAAYAAQKTPDDALVANNLGAVLRGMHDYARAAIALQYAKSLAPDSPVIANNLGWLAMGQGDTDKAGDLFRAAAARNGQIAPALLGEGLVALCAGRPAQALPLLRASVKSGFSEVAEAAIDSAEADLARAGNASADTASPSVYGTLPTVSGAPPSWQDPPFPKSAGKLAAMVDAPRDPLRNYIDNYWGARSAAVQRTLAAMAQHLPRATTTGNAARLEFSSGYRKELFEVNDIEGIFSRMAKPLQDKWSKDVAKAVQDDGCYGCANERYPLPHCEARIRTDGIHSGLYAEEVAGWTQLRKDFNDIYAFEQPLIAQIRDASLAQFETANVDSWIVSEGSAFAGPMPLWEHEANAAYDLQLCGKALAPSVVVRALKPYKVDPTACRSGSIAFNFGFANLTANCEKMSLSIGEFLVGAAEWKFAPDYTMGADGVLRPTGTDWSNDQITIFAGAGASSNTGAASLSGAAGGFVTIQNGELIDAGEQASIGGSLGTGALSLQEGGTARVGIMSGPDVTSSVGTRVGAPLPE